MALEFQQPDIGEGSLSIDRILEIFHAEMQNRGIDCFGAVGDRLRTARMGARRSKLRVVQRDPQTTISRRARCASVCVSYLFFGYSHRR